jgi:succinyl-CoA synthetase alpha subunit
MSILIDRDTRVVVQGITGNEGTFHARQMLRYGTAIMAGVTPGKGGQNVDGIPVYEHVADTVARHQANTSIIFVPARFARSAVLEAIAAGIRLIVVVTESIPIRDSIELLAVAKTANAVIVGPNTAGILSPTARNLVGIMPTHIFRPGTVGMVARSGTLTYEIAWHITSAGLGQSTCVGIGGDPIVGTDFVAVLERFRGDDETSAVVLIGEIGGSAEEVAAEYIRNTNYPKKVVAYIAGRSAPPDRRMGHAGAIIMGDTGSAQGKVAAFVRAGVAVAAKPSEIPRMLG